MAFEPVLTNDKAIRLNPLVCAAFNADFDGDQMNVHVPLSMKARIEAKVLMMPTKNILSSKDGEPIIKPSQDIVLGIYYLTEERENARHVKTIFSNTDEVRSAYDAKVIDEHTKIKVRIDGKQVDTITGRVIFKEILPHSFPFTMINKTITKTDIEGIIGYLYNNYGEGDTVDFLNSLQRLGFEYATKSGISISMDDFIATKKNNNIYKMVNSGAIKGTLYIDETNYKKNLSPQDHYYLTNEAIKMSENKEYMATKAHGLMRGLVYAANNVIVSEDDCGTVRDTFVTAITDNGMVLLPLEDRIIGRVSAGEIRDPNTGMIIIGLNEVITRDVAKKIVNAGIDKVAIRSVFGCGSDDGVCAKCYGSDLSTGLITEIGEPVGIVSAQSIGEPVYQHVMDTRYSVGKENDMTTFGLPKIIALFDGKYRKEKSDVALYKILNNYDIDELRLSLLNELQYLYRSHNMNVNDKHFEVIIRRMTEWIEVREPGDTLFTSGEVVKRGVFFEENALTSIESGRTAKGQPVLLGITKVSLFTESWLTAAAFRETTNVLIEAGINGKIDWMKGLSENAIIGKLIPAGIGFLER